MAVDYMEVMGALGAVTAKHPQTVGLLMQTFQQINSNMDKYNKIASQYQQAAGQANGPLDQAGIIMQLLAQHPDVSSLVTQTLASWQSRIPDLIQVITEFQVASTEAAKT